MRRSWPERRVHDCRKCGAANGRMNDGTPDGRVQTAGDGIAHWLVAGSVEVTVTTQKPDVRRDTLQSPTSMSFHLCPPCAAVFLDELRERGFIE